VEKPPELKPYREGEGKKLTAKTNKTCTESGTLGHKGVVYLGESSTTKFFEGNDLKEMRGGLRQSGR